MERCPSITKDQIKILQNAKDQPIQEENLPQTLSQWSQAVEESWKAALESSSCKLRLSQTGRGTIPEYKIIANVRSPKLSRPGDQQFDSFSTSVQYKQVIRQIRR